MNQRQYTSSSGFAGFVGSSSVIAGVLSLASLMGDGPPIVSISGGPVANIITGALVVGAGIGVLKNRKNSFPAWLLVGSLISMGIYAGLSVDMERGSRMVGSIATGVASAAQSGVSATGQSIQDDIEPGPSEDKFRALGPEETKWCKSSPTRAATKNCQENRCQIYRITNGSQTGCGRVAK